MSVVENNLNVHSQAQMSGSESLPDFARPPVIEVALSLQFKALDKLSGPMIGLLWGKFKEKYPTLEQHPPLEPVIERFGADALPKIGVRFQFLDSPPQSRVWFVSEGGSELIQVQEDRFVHNWRKLSESDRYPRYSTLRTKLVAELEVFRKFVEQEGVSEINFNQTEVTYVNHIVAGEGWERHGQLSNILTIHSSDYSDQFFTEPENIQTHLRYIIPNADGTARGRLHVSVVPMLTPKDKRPAINLTLTARCAPDGSGSDAITCLDLGHRWIVKGFASITTKEMHQIWGRQDEQ